MKRQTTSSRQNTALAVFAFFLVVLIAAGCSTFSKSRDKQSFAGNSDESGNANAGNTALAQKTIVPASKTSPPTPGFEKYAVVDTGKYTMEVAFSAFDKKGEYLRNVDYRYKYTDKRNANFHGEYGVDAQLQIKQFDSPESVQSRIKKRIAAAIPIEKAGTVKMPRCIGEKSGSDDFEGPEKLVKRLNHPNGGEIIILRSGDFNDYECNRESNRSEYAIWADGAYYFEVNTEGFLNAGEGNGAYTGFGRAEEFALDYLAVLGQSVGK